MNTRPHSSLRTTRGFTLIELMIAVVVIGILAAIAYPSYTRYIQQSRRVDAQSGLSAIQLAQEKYKFSLPSYTTSLSDLSVNANTPEGYYTLAITSATATGYTATATAASGTSQASDTGCTIITMTVNAGAVATFSPTTCFKK